MIGAFLDQLRHARRVKTWSQDQSTGRRGEDLAHRYLMREGFTIVARNYSLSTGDGEADLIARDGDDLVIVEVKTRESGSHGPPERAIGPDKQRALTRLARAYARKANVALENTRCDVVTVLLTPQPRIEHFRDAIRLITMR
jgi:putative endonuclease